MQYTKEQDRAVHTFRQNILVSAGAGAGKTRVLVNRIAEMMMDQDHPVSADEFLVLTFTNAAAAEMKERISREMQDRLEQDPSNSLLLRQLRLIKCADISTVHSFCNHLIRTHFEQLGLDPSFRIGEEGELVLLVSEVMEETLEEAYQVGDQAFLSFVEAYAPEKSDTVIEGMVENLYRFSRGFPDAASWYDRILSDLRACTTLDGLNQSHAMTYLLNEAKRAIHDLSVGLLEGMDAIGQEADLSRYYALLLEDAGLVEALKAAKSYGNYYEILSNCRLADLPRPKKAEKEHPLYEEAKSLHTDFRDGLRDLMTRLFAEDDRELCKEAGRILGHMEVLIHLTRRFEALYAAKKREKNVYDFDDLEHMALALLVDHYDQEGQPCPSETALELRHRYKEIFVDEYQDTNLVQETLLKVLSEPGINHLFQVGDVKQSIYRFRMARPDLFLDRYEEYEDSSAFSDEELYKLPPDGRIRIELQDNFRSGKDVLHTCNFFFYQLMTREFGGLDYSDAVALRPGQGAPLEDAEEQSEILLLVDDEEKENLEAEISRIQAETAMIAKKIKALLEEGYQYDDMVILLRSASGYAEPMAMFLNKLGIPASCDSQTGYFKTREIRLMMNYLSIVDNVYQDIPMASVLLSSFANVSEEELAKLKTQVAIPSRKSYTLYDLMKLYLEEGDDPKLKAKLTHFLMQLETFRQEKKELPIGQLIWNIYIRTGFFYDVQLMPEGDKRKENLLMLLSRAEDYEQTIYKGLFYFIRYMEQLRSYEIELAMARDKTEGKALVRIMTIHKSKGLEFPVVFVSSLAKRFNKMDMTAPVLHHPELGIGLSDVDLERREKKDSFLKMVIKNMLEKDTLEEELRVLYVAMTRAKNRLILTGMVKEKQLCDEKQLKRIGANPLTASSMLDWILAALRSHAGFQEILKSRGMATPWKTDPRGDSFRITMTHYSELADLFMEEEEDREPVTFEAFMESLPADRSGDAVRNAFARVYPYEHERGLKRKYTVTELKLAGHQAVSGQEEGQDLVVPYEREALKPQFLMEEKKEATGTARGTIVHKIMELLPMGQIKNKKDLYDALLEIERVYPPCSEINMKKMYQDAEHFLGLDLGQELARLDREGRLKREIPFTVGIPITKVYPEIQSDELAVIQGVIDACAEGDDGLWIIDYKTDRVKEEESKQLLDHYSTQMLYYKLALEQILEKKVSRIYIYSFALGRFIPVYV